MTPILVNTISHSVKDPLGTVFIRKETHRSGSPSNLPEIALQRIGSPYLLPQFPGKRVVMETMVQVLFHTPDRPLFVNLPIILPDFEPLYSLPAAAGIEDVLSFCHAGLQVHSSQLAGDIPQFMNDASLDFEKGVNIFECLQESWITISGDELQSFPS